MKDGIHENPLQGNLFGKGLDVDFDGLRKLSISLRNREAVPYFDMCNSLGVIVVDKDLYWQGRQMRYGEKSSSILSDSIERIGKENTDRISKGYKGPRLE